MTIDPVCEMEVQPGRAPAQVLHEGRTYYFCSHSCQKEFSADPRKYTGGATPPDHARHDAPA